MVFSFRYMLNQDIHCPFNYTLLQMHFNVLAFVSNVDD